MKRTAPAAERNQGPILEVLRDALPARARVLEIASGTGQHAVAFARELPQVSWQPSDADPHALASVRAWQAEAGEPRVLPPVWLDVTADAWPAGPFDAVVAINLIHIAPWEACRALLAGASRVLVAGGVLFLYGPFRVRDRPTAPSNEAFDADLRVRDPRWGVRWLHEVAAAAREVGLELERLVDMPANNLSVVFRRADGAVAANRHEE